MPSNSRERRLDLFERLLDARDVFLGDTDALSATNTTPRCGSGPARSP
jgi:hypothetical protein